MKRNSSMGKITRSIGVAIVTLALCSTVVGVGYADEAATGLEPWAFVIGDWDLVEKRYDFDGKHIQTNAGRSHFSYVMNNQRIQELQAVPRGEDKTAALHIFVYNPRSDEIEIARTDSGHYAFSVIKGKMSGEQIDLIEKHPNPDSQVRRRFTYKKLDSNHFSRRLDFSTDEGQSWFTRSEWVYSRKQG